MEPIRGHCQWMMWGSTGSLALLLDQTTRWRNLIKDAFSCTHRIIDCKRLWFLTTADEIIDIIPVKSWGFSGAFLQQPGSYYSNCLAQFSSQYYGNLVVNICLFEKFQVLATLLAFSLCQICRLKKQKTPRTISHMTRKQYVPESEEGSLENVLLMPTHKDREVWEREESRLVGGGKETGTQDGWRKLKSRSWATRVERQRERQITGLGWEGRP